MSGTTSLGNRFVWMLFIPTSLLSAAYLAWVVLAQVNFLYPLWHDLIGIDRTIEVYAPRNRYRGGFELTTKAERVRLFAGIVDAIHDQGRGLRDLVYQDAAGRRLCKLLREPEIIHLRDVARLIDRLRPAGVTVTIATALLLIVIRRGRFSMPSVKSLFVALLAPLAAVTATVLLLGPVTVFYSLHTLIFPSGHQWFFYYQDSLMSTMMQAPNLFGYVAIVWAALSLLSLLALIEMGRRAGGPHLRGSAGH